MCSIINSVRKILDAGLPRDEKLLSICRLINENMKNCDWVGLYIVEGENLILGPFIGSPTEHTRIPFGKGICGQAAETQEIIVVDDVEQETNYLSCSVKVKSEIVLPIKREGKMLAEMDIDSHQPGAFTAEDRKLLEQICAELVPSFNSKNEKGQTEVIA